MNKTKLIIMFSLLMRRILCSKELDLLILLATITSPINNLNYGIIMDGKNRCKKIITKRVV